MRRRSGAAWCEPFQTDEEIVQMARPVPGRQMERRAAAERGQARGVATPQHHVRKSRRDELAVAELVHRAVSDKTHGLRRNDEQESLQVGVLLEQPYV